MLFAAFVPLLLAPRVAAVFTTPTTTCECDDLDPCYGPLDQYSLTDVNCTLEYYLSQLIPIEGIPEPFYGKVWAIRERGAASTPTVTIATVRLPYTDCPQYKAVSSHAPYAVEVDLASAIVFVREDTEAIQNMPWLNPFAWVLDPKTFAFKCFFSLLRGYRFEVLTSPDPGAYGTSKANFGIRVYPSWKDSVPTFFTMIVDFLWGAQDLLLDQDGEYVRTMNGLPFYYVDEIWSVSDPAPRVVNSTNTSLFLSNCEGGEFQQLIMGRAP